MEINTSLVQSLIRDQFSEWQDLEIKPVAKSGHDNRTFHLGDDMAIRLPSGADYAAQVAKENKWLPYLQNHLAYPISKPLAAGEPTAYYPYPWSINRWIKADVLRDDDQADRMSLAKELREALKALQCIPCEGGPAAGKHNFYRGGDLKIYHNETQDALTELTQELPVDRLAAIWQDCIATTHAKTPVWVHGDVAPGNILMKDHHFYGLIDFGILGIGDPACDYAMAWTYFHVAERALFLQDLDQDMIARARGWALWKALITYHDRDDAVRQNAHETIQAILEETN